MAASELAKGELWWVELGEPGGHSQQGHRPAIVVADVPEANSVVVVPMTTNLERIKFPSTFLIEPSPQNRLGVRNVALIFQVRHLDRRFMDRPIGTLDQGGLAKLDALLHDMLRLS